MLAATGRQSRFVRDARMSCARRRPRRGRLASSSARTRAGASGSAKSTVPSATAAAPAAMNSSASRPVRRRPCRRSAARSRGSRRRRRRARPASAPALSSRPPLRRGAAAGCARRARGRGSCSRARARRRPPPRRRAPPRRGPARPARASRRAAVGVAARPAATISAAALGGVDVRTREVQLDRDDLVPVEQRRRSPRSRPRRSRRPRPRSARRALRAAAAWRRGTARCPGFWSPIEFSIPWSVSAIRDRLVALARLRGDGLRHERVERARDVGRDERVQAARGVKQQASTGPSTQRRLSSPSISTTQP